MLDSGSFEDFESETFDYEARSNHLTVTVLI